MSTTPLDALPAALGPYRVLCRIARGATGEVLLGCAADGERVALKRSMRHLAGDAAVRRALLDEGRRLASLTSPRVVSLRASFEHEGAPVLALEYVHGVSLAYLLDAWGRRGERPEAGVVARVMADALEGLEALHGAGLVHGDVNPRNILVGRDGAARLCDLEVSGPEGERSGVFRGTAGYGAPEVWRGEPRTARSDLFSAGVVQWESLRGERLFRGEGAAATMGLVLGSPVAAVDEGRPELGGWRAAIEGALQRDPGRRPASAGGLRALLEEAGGQAPRERVSAVVETLAGELLCMRLALGGRLG